MFVPASVLSEIEQTKVRKMKISQLEMVDSGVEGVAVLQADGHPTEAELGGTAAAQAFLDGQQPLAATLAERKAPGIDSIIEINPLNTSGFEPLDLRVLVLPDPIEERTSGGIILPDAKKERDKFAQQLGTLIAVGENAWEEASGRSPNFRRPRPGERIVFSRYGGVLIEGRDGKEYRLMNDIDIVCRVINE